MTRSLNLEDVENLVVGATILGTDGGGDKPVAMVPDLMCLIDESGYGVTNSKVREGLTVSVLGVRSPPIWRTEKGLNYFGPKRLGFPFDYVPVEELQWQR